MKLVYELSKERIAQYILIIETVKAPNAFLLGKAVSWLREKMNQFPNGKTIRITLESIEGVEEKENELLNKGYIYPR